MRRGPLPHPTVTGRRVAPAPPGSRRIGGSGPGPVQPSRPVPLVGGQSVSGIGSGPWPGEPAAGRVRVRQIGSLAELAAAWHLVAGIL